MFIGIVLYFRELCSPKRRRTQNGPPTGGGWVCRSGEEKSLLKNYIYTYIYIERRTASSLSKTIVLTSLSSSSRVNSFFLTCLSWLRKLNSAAFFWSLANLFSYLETFFSVGFMLTTSTGIINCRIEIRK